MELEERNNFPWPLVVGAVIVLLIMGGISLLVKHAGSSGAPGEQKLPFGAAEQAYATRIHFLEPKMAQADNMLRQQFTYIHGVLSNDGDRNLGEVELTFEFHDPFNQVVLREPRRIVGEHGQHIGGGERRQFDISFDNIPSEWNQQYPSIRVTGLVFE
ncbi:MAG: FxLYD domain-containing protein [Candidatus Acidiferrales bacterium]